MHPPQSPEVQVRRLAAANAVLGNLLPVAHIRLELRRRGHPEGRDLEALADRIANEVRDLDDSAGWLLRLLRRRGQR